MGKWVATILGSVIAALIVWFLKDFFTGDPPTFPEQLSGVYSLQTWTETRDGPIEVGIVATGGTLRIEQTGAATWTLDLQDRYLPEATGRIECVGRVEFGPQQLRWVPGEGNQSIDWHRNLMSLRDDIWPTFCGGGVMASDPYTLHLETGSGPDILEMGNSRGTLTWRAN